MCRRGPEDWASLGWKGTATLGLRSDWLNGTSADMTTATKLCRGWACLDIRRRVIAASIQMERRGLARVGEGVGQA